MRSCLYGKLNGHRRFIAGFKLLEQGVEMIYGGELVPYLVAVVVSQVFCGDVAGHDFFAEDVAITLNLFTAAGT